MIGRERDIISILFSNRHGVYRIGILFCIGIGFASGKKTGHWDMNGKGRSFSAYPRDMG